MHHGSGGAKWVRHSGGAIPSSNCCGNITSHKMQDPLMKCRKSRDRELDSDRQIINDGPFDVIRWIRSCRLINPHAH